MGILYKVKGSPPFLGCPLAQVLDRSSAKHTQAICFQAQRYNVLSISKPFSNQILIKSKPYSSHFPTKSKPYPGKIPSKSKPNVEGNAVISKPRGGLLGQEHQAASGGRGRKRACRPSSTPFALCYVPVLHGNLTDRGRTEEGHYFTSTFLPSWM